MSAFTRERWQETSTLFADLIELEPAEQRARLDAIGQRDPEMRTALESLLAADAAADERLAKFEFGVTGILRQSSGPSFSNSEDPIGIIGTTISHFRVEKFLAAGGMGVVYRGEDTQLNRPVALKFPLPDKHLDDSVKQRFMREAKSIGMLDHVNLCAIYEAGESEHGLFIAMPLYAGMTLKQRLKENAPLSIEESLNIGSQIASGLSVAHDAGIVHRDLTPGNVMLLPDGTVKILDFGLAKVSDTTRTKSGMTLGTVSYMAPEQIRGSGVTPQTDLWSLGVLLYEMLTGLRPFGGEHEVSIVHAILNDEPKAPMVIRADLPRSVQSIILALLQKEPASRYPSAKILGDDMAGVLRGKTPSFKPRIRPRAAAWLRKRRTAAAILLTIALMVTLGAIAPGFSEALNRPTRNAEAYRLYLRGTEYEQRGPRAAAESLYMRALALDSNFAIARARLAIVYAGCRAGGSRDCPRRNLEDPVVDRLEDIRREAEYALRQKPRLADAHFAMGLYWEQREDPAKALPEFDRARSGLDSRGELHAAIGRTYRAQGRWNEAIRELEKAIELDSKDVTSIADLATTFSRLRRYEESVSQWNRYLTLMPDAYQGMIIKGNVYLRWKGTVDTLAAIVDHLPADWRKRAVATRVLVARIRNRPADAFAALDEAPRQGAEDPSRYEPSHLLRAQVYMDLGDTVRARVYFDSLRATIQRGGAPLRDFRRQVTLGLALAGLGRSAEAKQSAKRAMQVMPPSRTVPAGTSAMRGAADIFAQIPESHDEAIRLLDQLMQMPAGREASAAFLRVDPALRPLRGDAAFQQLLGRYPAQ